MDIVFWLILAIPIVTFIIIVLKAKKLRGEI